MQERLLTVPTKPWYKSKMFWLGAAQVVGGISNLVVESLQSGEGWAALATGVLTVIFRYVTKQPMTFTGKESKVVSTSRYHRTPGL